MSKKSQQVDLRKDEYVNIVTDSDHEPLNLIIHTDRDKIVN